GSGVLPKNSLLCVGNPPHWPTPHGKGMLFGVTVDARRTDMMAPQDLASELQKEPFEPFRIVTTTGKTYDITERDRPLILVGKRTVIIGFRVPETDANFDRYEVVALVHIV